MNQDEIYNLKYFEATTTFELYQEMAQYQQDFKLRFLSVEIQKENDKVCCIALIDRAL